MSLRRGNNDSDGDNPNTFGSSTMRKSKKKKKLGLFSFRSKKTRTINNNIVVSEQSDSVSVCSEMSTTEDGSYSLATTRTEKHSTTVECAQDNQMQSHSDSLADDFVKDRGSTNQMNGQTQEEIDKKDTVENTAASSTTTTENTLTIVTPVTEDENSQPAHQAAQHFVQANGEQLSQQGTRKIDDCKAEFEGTKAQQNIGTVLDRPNSIQLERDVTNLQSSNSTKFQQQSLRRQKQKIFAEHRSSSTEYSSYPATPVKGRFKSKKYKMPIYAGATHKLTVRLLSGQNLAARDSNGKSDPYVKFKIGSKTVFKSRTCKVTLNPRWDEEFKIPVKMTDEITVHVFDRDVGMRDDFMGSSSFDLQSLIEDEETELSLDLEDQDATEPEELGRIHLAVTLVPILEDMGDEVDSHNSPEDMGDTMSLGSLRINSLSRSDSNASDISRRTNMCEKYRKTKVPIGTAVLQLVSGKDLPARDSNGLSDPYVRMQLGKQKHKSKVCYKTLDPVWKEEFVFQLTSRESFDRDPSSVDITVWDRDSYRKDDFIGRCDLDLGSLEYDKTHTFNMSLTDAPGTIMLLVTLHSTSPTDSQAINNQFVHVEEKYTTLSTLSDISDIGLVEVKIIRANGCRAADIGGKSDPFCVVELCNARGQTQTCYKTLDPVWNKTLTFPIKDIHDVLDITVYDEDKDQNDFLGRLAIPLLRVRSGVERVYALKDRKLLGRTKGTITLQIEYIFNPARAAIRTFSPREEKHMMQEARFKRQLLTRNFSRVWACIQAVLQTLEFVNSCFTWQNPLRSATAFFVYLLIVWNIELYMLPILLLLLLLKNYFEIIVQKTKVDRRLKHNPDENFQDDDDDDDTEDTKNNVSFLQRLKVIEEVLLKVQNILDWIACLLERIHNTFTWSVPFLSTLAVIVLSIVVIILYFVSLRTIALLWGINKFTKRLRKPNFIPNNELLDFLSRIPSEVELDEFQELPVLQGSPKGSKRKKS